MGHFVFTMLHVIAIFFFLGALLVTIPLHLIYAVLAGRSRSTSTPSGSAPSAATKVCPQCAESVLKNALKCKHCGHDLLVDEVRGALREPRLTGLSPIEVGGDFELVRAAIARAKTEVAPEKLFTAVMTLERSSRDSDAVRVEIAGHLVGYLPRNVAARFERACRIHFTRKHGPLPSITTPAEIRGDASPPAVFVYLDDALVDRLAPQAA